MIFKAQMIWEADQIIRLVKLPKRVKLLWQMYHFRTNLSHSFMKLFLSYPVI